MNFLQYFGKAWPKELAAISHPPEETRCDNCEEKIRRCDSGVRDGDIFLHRECFFARFFGSVAHQKGLCRCVPDDRMRTSYEECVPTVNRRKAARDAMKHFFESKNSCA